MYLGWFKCSCLGYTWLIFANEIQLRITPNWGYLIINSPILDEYLNLGSSLWFEEAWHWYVLSEKKNDTDKHIVSLFDRYFQAKFKRKSFDFRLTWECPDSIDWTPKLDIIFTKVRFTYIKGFRNFNFESSELNYSTTRNRNRNRNFEYPDFYNI